jgi:hypothetical protein
VAQIDASTAHVVVPMPESDEPAPSVPATRPAPQLGRGSRIFLALLSILGGVVMVLAALDPQAKAGDRPIYVVLAVAFAGFGIWMVRGALHQRRERDAR